MGGLPDELQELLVIKWRLTPGWTAGEGPGRALSVDEVAARLGLPAEVTREHDWRLVDDARSVRRQIDPALPRFTMVPIDAAQPWWDREWSWLYNPDGSRKPREQWGPEKGTVWYQEHAATVHEISDREEIRLHVLLDHGRDYAVRPTAGSYSMDHRDAHVYDGEDEEWDRQLRGIALPPPPI